MNRIEARAFAQQIHVSQVGDDGRPHFEHTARVADRAEAKLNRLPKGTLKAGETESILAAAELHDSTEDFEFTGVTPDILREKGCTSLTIAIIAALDRPRGEGAPTYMGWINLMAGSNRDCLALWIGTVVTKLADNEDNLSPQRVATLAPGKQSITKRWERSKAVLSSALTDAGYAEVLD